MNQNSAAKTFDQTDEEGVRDLLVGRRVVTAEEGSFPTNDGGWHETASGRLTLDDGRQILVIPNEGGCSCGAGDYSLTSLAKVDNIITAVRLANTTEPSEYDEGPTKYEIFVVADAVEINLLTIDGDDGNGYYGTGYKLIVVAPDSGPSGVSV